MILTKEDLIAIEGLFAGKFEKIDTRFDRLEVRMDNLEGQMGKLEGRMENLEGRVENLEGNVSDLKNRMEHVESDLCSLRVGQIQLSTKLNEISHKVESTYKLALENWGQIEESKTRLALLEG